MIACLALMIALGGTAYAQLVLPRNSVTTIQVRDRSLLAKDFTLPALAALKGRAGATGAAGSRRTCGAGRADRRHGRERCDRVQVGALREDGTIVNQNSDIRLVTRPSSGSYIVNVGTRPRAARRCSSPPHSPAATSRRAAPRR